MTRQQRQLEETGLLELQALASVLGFEQAALDLALLPHPLLLEQPRLMLGELLRHVVEAAGEAPELVA